MIQQKNNDKVKAEKSKLYYSAGFALGQADRAAGGVERDLTGYTPAFIGGYRNAYGKNY